MTPWPTNGSISHLNKDKQDSRLNQNQVPLDLGAHTYNCSIGCEACASHWNTFSREPSLPIIAWAKDYGEIVLRYGFLTFLTIRECLLVMKFVSDSANFQTNPTRLRSKKQRNCDHSNRSEWILKKDTWVPPFGIRLLRQWTWKNWKIPRTLMQQGHAGDSQRNISSIFLTGIPYRTDNSQDRQEPGTKKMGKLMRGKSISWSGSFASI